jgi:hypothetical protein
VTFRKQSTGQDVNSESIRRVPLIEIEPSRFTPRWKVVKQYAERLRAGEQPPPVWLYALSVDSPRELTPHQRVAARRATPVYRYGIADGLHRIQAARLCGLRDIEALIVEP